MSNGLNMEVWQENLERWISEYGGDSPKSTVARKAGIHPSTISKYIRPGTANPTPKILKAICAVLGKRYEDLYKKDGKVDTEDESQHRRLIFNRDIRLIAEWVATQEEPDYISKTIRFMVEQNYPDFKEWQKMQKKSGERNKRKNRAASANGY